MLSGRFINELKGSNRAPHILPEHWKESSNKRCREAKAEWEVMKKAAWDSGASSSAPCSPQGVARDGSPHGEAEPSQWSSALDRAGTTGLWSLDDILREKIDRDYVPAPAMPTVTPDGIHRQRIPDHDLQAFALVARPLTKADILREEVLKKLVIRSGAVLRPSRPGTSTVSGN